MRIFNIYLYIIIIITIFNSRNDAKSANLYGTATAPQEMVIQHLCFSSSLHSCGKTGHCGDSTVVMCGIHKMNVTLASHSIKCYARGIRQAERHNKQSRNQNPWPPCASLQLSRQVIHTSFLKPKECHHFFKKTKS